MTEVYALYDSIAKDFDRDRSRSLTEAAYLGEVLPRLERDACILDLGCGSAEPIARFFIDKGCQLTGVDAAPAMIALCRARFPDATWIAEDMRTLALGRRFDAILAWDSCCLQPAPARASQSVISTAMRCSMPASRRKSMNSC